MANSLSNIDLENQRELEKYLQNKQSIEMSKRQVEKQENEKIEAEAYRQAIVEHKIETFKKQFRAQDKAVSNTTENTENGFILKGGVEENTYSDEEDYESSFDSEDDDSSIGKKF